MYYKMYLTQWKYIFTRNFRNLKEYKHGRCITAKRWIQYNLAYLLDVIKLAYGIEKSWILDR